MNRKIDQRIVTFKHSDPALTSKRVSIILSDPKDSVKLANAVRAIRNNGNTKFKLSSNTESKIEKAALELIKAV